MTEEEKMLLGEMYSSKDKELMRKLMNAKKLCNEYNQADNVIIGAGSVVTKDILSNVVAVGNPCKILRNI